MTRRFSRSGRVLPETSLVTTTTSSGPEGGWQRLVGNALTVTVAGGFANALNVGVTFGIARILSTNGYGAYGQLVGVFFVIALSGSALGVAVVRRAGYYIVRGDHVLTMHCKGAFTSEYWPPGWPAALLLCRQVSLWRTGLATGRGSPFG